MIDIGALKSKIVIDDTEARGKLKSFGDESDKAGSKLAGFGKMAGTTVVAGVAAIGAAAVATAGIATKAFGDFEEGINKVATIADTSVMSVENIKSGVLDLSNDMGIATGELSEAMYQAISATGDTANALTYVEKASKLAKGGFTETSKAMDAVTKTMNAYGETGEEAFGKVSDMLVMTQNLGITTVDELSGALYNVVPTAAALGLEFDQVSAAMATMTSFGTPTSVATTQIRSALNELSKSGTKASDTFKELSGKSFTEFIDGGGNLSEAMVIMQDGAEKTGLSVTDLFSSVEAGAAALALTGTGADKFNDSLTQMRDASGATDEAYATMSEGINASFNKLANAGKNVLVQLGDKLAPVMIDLANWINSNMPQIQAVIEKTFNAIGVVIDVVVKGFNILIGWVKDLTKACQEEGTKQNQIWTNIKTMFLDFFNAVKEFVVVFVDQFKKIWEEWGTVITTYTQGFVKALAIVFETVFKTITNLLNVFSKLFEGDWKGLWEAVKKLVFDLLTGILKFIQNSFDTMINIAKDIIPKMIQAGRDIFNGLWDGLESVWNNISNWVSDKVSWMVDKLAFWDNGAKKMETQSQTSNTKSIDGSHRAGLSYVPWDGYKSLLHEGEMVLTKAEANTYRGSTNGGINIEGSLIELTVNGTPDESILRALKKETDNIANYTIGKLNHAFSIRGYRPNPR